MWCYICDPRSDRNKILFRAASRLIRGNCFWRHGMAGVTMTQLLVPAAVCTTDAVCVDDLCSTRYGTTDTVCVDDVCPLGSLFNRMY